MQRHMQSRLFGARTKRLPPMPDGEMWRMLRQLRAAPQLEAFEVWLVGSRVEAGRDTSDVDLVLSRRRSAGAVSDHMIESALWYCRNYGLYAAKHCSVVDPCFRAEGPTLTAEPLPPHALLKSVKLYSPRLRRLVLAGRILEHRLLGRFSIEFSRLALDTDYYPKLPRGSFANGRSAYLRPAIQVTCTV
jgi:hypothetical protein